MHHIESATLISCLILMIPSPVRAADAASAADVANEEVKLPFVSALRNWHAVDEQHVLIEDLRGQWYLATLQAPAWELPFVQDIGFDTWPSGSLGRLSAVVIKGVKFPITSLKKAPNPDKRPPR